MRELLPQLPWVARTLSVVRLWRASRAAWGGGTNCCYVVLPLTMGRCDELACHDEAGGGCSSIATIQYSVSERATKVSQEASPV